MTTPDTVLLAHGSGGSMMHELIESFFDARDFEELQSGDDAAVLSLCASLAASLDASLVSAAQTPRIAFSTDTFVVTPHFFPGGDIGRLAVCGTVNDVATSGAVPLWLSVGFILEEGFPLADLKRICASMTDAAKEAGVRIVTGDTKVVDRGHGDGIYINTSGIGVFGSEKTSAQCSPNALNPSAPGSDTLGSNAPTLGGAQCRPGDKILLSGTLGDHGIAIISTREGLSFSTSIKSDAAPLNHLVQAVLRAAPNTRCFRDPTRGGLASTLNELAGQSNTVFEIDEDAVPVRDEVRGACDMLGFDVFQVANEGKMIAVVPADEAFTALEAMRASRYGENAALIGEVLALSEANVSDVGGRSDFESVCSVRDVGGRSDLRSVSSVNKLSDTQLCARVYVRTAFGTRRILDMLVGEQLPRIC